MSHKINVIRSAGYYFLLLSIVITIAATGCVPQFVEIQNPYESVNWLDHKQYKANFHTHTTMSDGVFNPHDVVDIYKELGYDILAITDHNEVTWPWTAFAGMEASHISHSRLERSPQMMPASFDYENRCPVTLQMLDIQANELSNHHHLGSFFNDHNGIRDIVESLQTTQAKNGITMLYHPGRYNYQARWYVDLYRRYDHLIGLEIYNQGDRYPNDRHMWDSILTVLMPDRPVWGYSNDDMHTANQIGRNWNLLILPELSHSQVRNGMEKGLSFFIYAPQGHEGPLPPAIQSIRVDAGKGSIEITATGYDFIKWIFSGTVLHEGSSFNLNDFEESLNYVRAELHGPGETVTGTQPFGIKNR
jgi:hypothetical protein